LPEVRGEDPFQIVYTSGSTGRPKGAVLAHRTAVNSSLLLPGNRIFALGAERCERRLLDMDFSFVAATIRMLRGLCNEKTLIIPTGEELSSVERLAALIEREDVTEVHWTPSRLLKLLSEPTIAAAVRRVRALALMGEKTPEGLLAAVRQHMPEAEIISNYGMSELMHLEEHLLEPGTENLLIGFGEGIGMHLLDDQGAPAAAGELGELCVSGPPARLGYYWADPEETERRYTLHPALGRIFHTGDLAVAEKGGFRLKGRADQMAKLRGMRVDLGAVEKEILTEPGIRGAVALIIGEGDRQSLCAYYTREPDANHTAPGELERRLRRRLAEELPYYMVPAFLTELAELPLNLNGKTDRLALSRMAPEKAAYQAAGSEQEKLLCELFAKVLGLPRPAGADDSFFALGGDSMAGMRLAGLLAEKGVRMEMKWLFIAPTPAQLAAYLAEEEAADAPIAPGLFRTLTPAQRTAARAAGIEEQIERVYPACAVTADRLRERDPWMMLEFWLIPFDGSTVERLQTRLAELVRAHQSLRSVFLLPEGERPVQAVLRDAPVPFSYEDCSSAGQEADTLSEKQKAYLGRLVRYDLAFPPEPARAPLYRFRLVRTGGDRAVLYLAYSHTLLDLQTVLYTVGELLDSGAVRPDGRGMEQYFARVLYGGRDEAEAYWSGLFDGHLTPLPAPAERDLKPSVRSLKAGGGALPERTLAWCRERGVTLAAALHLCLGRALLSLTGEDSCAFLSVSSGRSGTEMELAGNFTHTFPFVFKRGCSLRDCQEQLIRAGAYAWVWSLPGREPFPVKEQNALVMDMADVYEKKSEMDERRLRVDEALDGIGLKAVFLQKQSQSEVWADRLTVQYRPASGYLYSGIYDPSRTDGGFTARLFEGLSGELETLLKGEK
ncbi:MAG: hypothetical protein E7298_14530, partial [Lachnospiraceae bacterium]|nr:hypothetical protein [Lachnospiraceae bacterium]